MTRRLLHALAALSLAATSSGCAAVFTQQARLDIDSQLRSRQASFVECYEAALKKDREMRGSLTLAFTVMPDGLVQNIRAVKSDLADEELKQCIVTKAGGMRVSYLTARPVEVTYPLKFSQADVPF